MQYLGNDRKTVSTRDAARLMGVDIRTIQRYIDSGKLQAEAAASVFGGGAEGTVYRIAVDELPVEAQIEYWQESGLAELGPEGMRFDLAGYRERMGMEAIRELRRKQRAALAARGLRREYDEGRKRGYTEALSQLAAALDIPKGTLYRWEREYAETGLSGLARKERADKDKPRSMCLYAREYMARLMLDSRKPPQSEVMDAVRKRAAELGPEACELCPYRNGTDARAEAMDRGEELPMCREDGTGMLAPESRHAVNRAVKLIPQQVLDFARRGERYWESNHLMACKREKPTEANYGWIGDHHQIDVMVIDRDGNIVRPWITAWEDAMSSAIIGWMLTLEPNSDTILTAFIHGAAKTVGSPFFGLPRWIYVDNGKDYRSRHFMGTVAQEKSLGRLNDEFAHGSLIQDFRIGFQQALPYRARSKNVERAFGTFEKKWTRKFPGWCGSKPSERPEDHPKELKRLIETGGLMLFDTFAEVYKREVIDAYNNYRSAEDNMTPIERWQNSPMARLDHPDYATLALYKSHRTERTVSLQGVRVGNTLYWHNAMAGLRKQEVVVLHDRGYNPSVTVLYKGHFLCEAEPIRTIKMFEDDRTKVTEHMAAQGEQRRAVKKEIRQIDQHVRGIYREAFVEEIDAQRDRAMAVLSSTTAQKAMAAKGEVAKKARRRAGEADEGEQRLRARLRAVGTELALQAERAREGRV